jgi:hypothetical protein
MRPIAPGIKEPGSDRGHSSFLGHFEAEVAALGQATFQPWDPSRAHLNGQGADAFVKSVGWPSDLGSGGSSVSDLGVKMLRLGNPYRC